MALSCIICARKVTKVVPEWSYAIEKLSKLKFEDIKSCKDKLFMTYEKQFLGERKAT